MSQPTTDRPAVVVGAQADALATVFDRCETVTELRSGVPVDNEEEGQAIAICTGPRQDWAIHWPTLRHLD